MIRTLVSNLRFLLNNRLSTVFDEQQYESYLRMEDYLAYEYRPDMRLPKGPCPKVLDCQETVSLLGEEPRSFVRLGDGEIDCIEGIDIPFQKYDKRLGDCLREMVEGYREDVYVGINHGYFNPTYDMLETVRRFYALRGRQYREWLLAHCSRSRPFWIAAGFNQPYMTYREFDFEGYYDRIMRLFEGKNLVLFIGKGLMQKTTSDVFRLAKSLDCVPCPSSDSFASIDQIVDKSRSYPEDTLLAYCIGPAAKYAVWALSREGRLAWDLGHLPADYDAYVSGTGRSSSEIAEFFAPDKEVHV